MVGLKVVGETVGADVGEAVGETVGVDVGAAVGGDKLRTRLRIFAAAAYSQGLLA